MTFRGIRLTSGVISGLAAVVATFAMARGQIGLWAINCGIILANLALVWFIRDRRDAI